MPRAHRPILRTPTVSPGSDARARAFTLLELLVALAMTGIIAGSMYSALRVGFRARASAEAAVEPIRTAELATGLLRADFESVVPIGGTFAVTFYGYDQTGQGGMPADSVEFYTLSNPNDVYSAQAAASGPGTMNGRPGLGASIGGNNANSTAVPAEIRKVSVSLVTSTAPGGGTEQVLVRDVTSNLLAEIQSDPQEEVLCRGVRSLNFRYFDGLTWQDSWDSTQVSNAIPSAVEMVIELDRSAGGQQRIISFPRTFLLSCSTLSPTNTATPTAASDTAAGGATP